MNSKLSRHSKLGLSRAKNFVCVDLIGGDKISKSKQEIHEQNIHRSLNSTVKLMGGSLMDNHATSPILI